jgi:hypothetical protein
MATNPINPGVKVTERIKAKAFELLEQHPDGLRYSHLHKGVQAADTTFKPNTISGSGMEIHRHLQRQSQRRVRYWYCVEGYRRTATDCFNMRPDNSVERGGLQAALANSLRRFAAPDAPHVKRYPAH